LGIFNTDFEAILKSRSNVNQQLNAFLQSELPNQLIQESFNCHLLTAQRPQLCEFCQVEKIAKKHSEYFLKKRIKIESDSSSDATSDTEEEEETEEELYGSNRDSSSSETESNDSFVLYHNFRHQRRRTINSSGRLNLGSFLKLLLKLDEKYGCMLSSKMTADIKMAKLLFNALQKESRSFNGFVKKIGSELDALAKAELVKEKAKPKRLKFKKTSTQCF
jgi:hypothetical protein